MNNIEVVQDMETDLLKAQKLSTAIYKLTHELKNPLSVCRGYLEMITSCDEAKKNKYLSIVTEEIRRSIHIINDYSEFGKIKKLDKEIFDFSFLMEEISIILGDLFKCRQGKIIYNYQRECFLYGDYQKIKQVVINILKNAIESKDKNSLWIKIITKEYKDRVLISFQDNGKGMSSEEIEKLKKEFFTTKENGTGLGIPYCEEIMHLHSGNMKIASKETVGTIVTLSFPK